MGVTVGGGETKEEGAEAGDRGHANAVDQMKLRRSRLLSSLLVCVMVITCMKKRGVTGCAWS